MICSPWYAIPINLPFSHQNDQRDIEEENNLDPGMKNLLANFKTLCRSEKQSDFIQFSAANLKESSQNKAGFGSGIEH